MRARDTLFARVIGRLLLNLVLVATVLWGFYHFRTGTSSSLAGLSEDRVRRAAAGLSDELTRTPRNEWTQLLGRHSQRHQAAFHLLNVRGQSLVGDAFRPPVVVRKFLKESLPPATESSVRRHLGRQFRTLQLTSSQLDSLEALWLTSLHQFRSSPDPQAVVNQYTTRLLSILTPNQRKQFNQLPARQFVPRIDQPANPIDQLRQADRDGNGELNADELSDLLAQRESVKPLSASTLPIIRPEVHTLASKQTRWVWAVMEIPVRSQGVSPTFSEWDVADLRLNPDGKRYLATLLIASDPADRSFSSEPWPWVTILLLVLGLSALFWVPLVKGITQPLAEVAKLTEQIAEGRFENRLGLEPRDEISRVAHAVDQMAERLEGFVGGQRRFLGDVAHELCAPLARLQVALGILEQHAEHNHQKQVENLQEEVTQMAVLVDELLLFTRTGAQNTAELIRVNLSDCIQSALKREAPSLELELKIPPNCAVLASPNRLARAFGNLARNSQQHAAKGGPLSVSAERQGDTVEVRVRDHGPGVPEDCLPQLFDPFFRLEPSRSRDTGGTGLGLAITKSAIEACGGEIHCRNHPGSGLEFRLHLPAAD